MSHSCGLSRLTSQTGARESFKTCLKTVKMPFTSSQAGSVKLRSGAKSQQGHPRPQESNILNLSTICQKLKLSCWRASVSSPPLVFQINSNFSETSINITGPSNLWNISMAVPVGPVLSGNLTTLFHNNTHSHCGNPAR